MTDSGDDPRQPTRGRAQDPGGDQPLTTFSERPQPNFALDPFHKVLLAVSMIAAVALPVYFFLRSFGAQGDFALHYDFTGDVTREGSLQEAAVILVLLSLLTIGCGVLTRYPRIFNFPVTLTRENVQRQYKNAVQMLVWIVAGMAAILAIMVGGWLGILSVDLMWLPLAAMGIVLIVFIRRMILLR
ncbi:hypothetical protein [Kocuria carniphila]|uniref:hypothetical protein n=1 Tax=Kocuria carniphila TaxID=262208 RepID=UPI0021A834F0|nr:hypothetical protein [Kocuria carniphila]MCT1803196.1 hypothetical protein [Kocuria carniphila]